MFDSGITAKNLISQIREEAEISYEIPDESFVQWMNALEQLLYSEVIREQKAYTFGIDSSRINAKFESDGAIRLVCGFPTYDDEADMRFEDIYAVYADDRQLIKSTLASGVLFPYTYYRELDDLGINVPEAPDEFKVVYLVRPVLKTTDIKNADGEVITPGNFGTEHVKVPVEFIELVSAKLRGEACKLANEDALAAKWLSDYNILLETFKTWIAGKQPSFGL